MEFFVAVSIHPVETGFRWSVMECQSFTFPAEILIQLAGCFLQYTGIAFPPFRIEITVQPLKDFFLDWVLFSNRRDIADPPLLLKANLRKEKSRSNRE